jgi:serine/threonine protein phosphatase PrpC
MTENSSSSPIVVHVYGRTDVGRTREHNEDAFIVADLNGEGAMPMDDVKEHIVSTKGALFMVADGMGGAAAGELASQMAIDVVLGELQKEWRRAPREDPQAFASALRTAAESANAQIHSYAAAHPENRGMGSTATIAGLLDDTLYLAQVGDSRGYLVRDGVARQITRDQSLVQRLVEAGELTAEQAELSDRRNIILQALGPDPSVKIDLTHQQVKRGDVLILCSDGLSGQVRLDDFGSVVRTEGDLVRVCARLIEMANEAGGPDNITVIAARFDGDGLVSANSADEVAHRVFQLDSESRVTLQVPALQEIPPAVEIASLPPGALSPPPYAPSDVPLATPEVRGPGLATLRLVFAALAVVVVGVFVAAWLRRS